jgi:hypothetical protein
MASLVTSLPSALQDGGACGLDVMRIIDAGKAPETDRRRRVRVPLVLTVQVFHGSQLKPLSGKTRNISSSGLYCELTEPLTIGEAIRVLLVIPAFDPSHNDFFMHLECHTKVMRVEHLVGGLFGVAFQIESYHVLAPVSA